ncbi:MAG TPA: NrfD/PsrC family molybdoenzyme membrane anchor subunit, partial [Blastocatellia bacterium]|nr:NrfD/PsrC family molybdoenzyme membrane anchor subunit [Blastocatellia bacterium]
WLFPYPNIMNVQPQFRSPLVWDVFAVSTYFTVSVIFWFVGLIPDLGTLRDRARSRAGQVIYGALAMGWRGSARHWKRYEVAYLLLAGLATPLVVSVHTVVSFDFTIAILPGWHSTIFPPYFVAGAIFSGFAMVLTIAIPLRWYYGLENLVTMRHLDNCGKLMLATGLIVAYGYLCEIFLSWYSKGEFEWFMTRNRMFGPYWMVFWSVMLLNVVAPQFLWLRRVRRSPTALFLVSMAVNVGMWVERYMIVVTSLTRDFMPSAWGQYAATVWDYTVFIGTIGFFVMMMFLFVRLLPAISISEVRTLLPQAEVKEAEEEEVVS